MKNPIKALINAITERTQKTLMRIRELGGNSVSFSSFGRDAYQSELVRACIRTLADQTAKAAPISNDDKLQRMLKLRPNAYMNGKDFLYKVRTLYELRNTVFILVMRDDGGKATGMYPIPCASYEGYQDEYGNIYVHFRMREGSEYWFAWEDLIVLRKDYAESDIGGEDNSPILNTLELINTSNESIQNAVKSTANLRGILKSTKSMLDPKDTKRIKEEFVKDYMDPTSGDGFGALDATTEFQQVNISPTITGWTTMREFRENVYRYYGVNDTILMGTATPEQMQTFYELRIEPFLVALSLEMTSKVFTQREISFGNFITFDSSTTQFMSMSDKLNLQAVVDRGAMSINEWREVLNLPAIEGGDTFVRRLDTAPVANADTQEDENE
ncbi:hypothetical protein BHK98_03920 [Hornefia porci]|uniref:Phage portal protein n=1 Tax=Hornefia porci TaxID=2652292 RepID=A0A1Q9JGB7_9FIRM|nr:phage portal protein [Hornefia porci]OLR55286.1 hypothetical protein BHK98_03920 [Hornefia porci]